MRIVVSVFLIFSFLLFGGLYLLFSSDGNDLLRPYVNQYLAKNVKGVKVEVLKFRLKPDFIGVNARVNDSVYLHALGDVALFQQQFDVNYTLTAEAIETKQVTLDTPISIKGKVKGTAERMHIQGEGKAFDSNITYSLALIETVPTNIKVDVNRAKLASIFALAKQKPFVDGYVTLHANMPQLDVNNVEGNATVVVEEGIFKRDLIEKEFNVTLPAKSSFVANLQATTENKKVLIGGKIDSSLATLLLKDGLYDLDKESLKSGYHLEIADMQILKPIVKQPLEGELKLDGRIGYTHGDVLFTGTSKSFSGESYVSFNGKRAEVKLKEVETQTLLKKLGQATLLQTLREAKVTPHKTNANVLLTTLNPLKGNFNIKLPATLEESGKSYPVTTLVDGTVKEGSLTAKVEVKSEVMQLSAKEIVYHLKKGTLHSTLDIAIDNLATLAPVVKQPLQGEFKATGEVRMKEGGLLDVQLSTQSFGGKGEVSVKGERVDAQLQDVNTATLLRKLGQSELLQTLQESKLLVGKSSATVTLSSVEKLKGNFTLKNSATLNKIPMKISLSGTVANEQVKAKLNVESSAIKMDSQDIHYNLPKSLLKASYNIYLPDLSKLQTFTGKQYRGDMRIDGTVQKGKVLKVTGKGKEFGGSVDFVLVDDQLKAHTKGTTVSKVLHMLDYPEVLEAISEVDLTYNLTTQSGTLHADLNKVQLLPTKLTTLVAQLSGIDLTREFFNGSRFDANIGKELIRFSLNATNRRHGLVIQKGELNRVSNKLNIPLDLTIDKKDIQARIVGTTESPRVTLDTSRYLKSKAKEKINKEIDKVIKSEKVEKQLNKYLDKNQQEQLKNLFKGML
jgi:hypothetical protein